MAGENPDDAPPAETVAAATVAPPPATGAKRGLGAAQAGAAPAKRGRSEDAGGMEVVVPPQERAQMEAAMLEGEAPPVSSAEQC